MRVTPVSSVYNSANYPKRRAQMSIRFDQHTVIDGVTGERFELDPISAWKKFNEIEGILA